MRQPLSFRRSIATAAGSATLLALLASATQAFPSPRIPETLLTRASSSGSAGHVFWGPRSERGHAGKGWLSPAAVKGGIIYGSSYNGGFINLYPLHGNNQQPVGQLTSGLVSPQGMVVDRKHRLWVANTNANNIVAFKRGATTPFRTLNDPGFYPVTVAVASDGTVYAANAQGTSGQHGNVVVYQGHNNNPSAVLAYTAFNVVLGLGVDASNNLYVSYIPTSGPPAIVVFPSGSGTPQPLPLADITISDIIFDTQSDLVMEDGSGGLGIWAPPYTGGPTRTLPGVFGNEPTFNKRETRVYVALADFSKPAMYGYDYTTGKLVDTITAGWTANGPIPYGVALDPPAPL
ncbi:MAG: hypothetical protein JO043_00040 [Candidatus Eremiobacteraeota bacterium]|nr:hypothetical protein [Candidatus Eremiobacteraeota bacterium]